MKKILFLFSSILLLWGCEKNEERYNSRQDDVLTDEVQNAELPEILYASVVIEQDSVTRTYIGGENRTKVLWQNNDAISFFSGNTHNARYDYEGEDGATSVELVKDDTKQVTTGYNLLKSQAVYPYNENVTVVYNNDAGRDEIKLTYPTTQKYALNSFGKDANIMVAAGENNEDDELYFRNACGYLLIKLYGAGTKVKSVTLSSVSGLDKIVGNAVVVASHDAAPVITMADDAATAVTLDCSNGGEGVALGANEENATEFWFCLPPVTFTNGIKITVTDTNGDAYTKQTSKTVNITRNNVLPMAALEFETNAPAATKLWYTRSDDKTGDENIVKFNDDAPNPFNASIKSHKWDGSKFVIEFNGPLTTINAYVFYDTEIATITLPEGVTTIGKQAFRNTPLTEITIPGSVNNIGIDAFYDCETLSKVTFLPSATKTPLKIGYQVDSYHYGPFYDSPLTSIDINRELILVDDDGEKFSQNEWWHGMFATKKAKDGTVGSASVKLGPQVEIISDYMFNYLPIESLTIPGTVKTIGNDVFNCCTKLASLTFEPSPTGEPLTIGYETDSESENLFQQWCPLTTLNLNRELITHFEEEVETINTPSEGLFGEITTLTNVTLGGQVKTLQKYMFAGTGITEIEIPATITSIAQNVFDECSALSSVTFVESETPLLLKSQGDGDGPFYDSPLATIVFNRPIDYRKLNDGEFNPTSDDLGVFAISSTAKSQITGGTNLTIGQYITTISNHMFCNLPIKALTIPGTVNTIGNNVFNGCTSLASLTFESSPTALTHGFNDDSDDDGPYYYSPLEKVVLNREINYTYSASAANANEGLFGNRTKLTSVTLGEQVKTLSPYMFAGTGITSLEIPATITSIAQNVFDGCSALSSVTFVESTIPLQLKSQGDSYGPFYDSPLATIVFNRPIVYTKLNDTVFTPTADELGVFAINPSLKSQITEGTNLTIGQNILTITNHMFCNLPIKALTIPGTVNTIGNDVFNGCTSLAELTFLPSPALTPTPLTIGYEAEEGEDENLFQEYCPLTTLNLNRELNYTFEEEAETIDSYSEGLFGEIPTLTSVTLGGQVKTLQKYMFAGTGITSLTIPGTVTSIANNVFDECTKLASLTFESSPKGEALTHGFNDDSDDDGPYYASPLEQVVLNREINYTYSASAANEGLFGNRTKLASVTLGEQVKTVSKYMFAGTGITALVIPGTVTEIKDYAFYECTALEDLRFEYSATPLTLGFQDWSDELGPFYQSPLKYIKLERDIAYNDNYANSCDGWDEGAFSNQYYESGDWTAKVIIGEQVTTLPRYMFATMRMQQLHIPESVENIGTGLVEKCEVLNAIVLYDTVKRPQNVADGAFGTFDKNNYVPGDIQYYIFVPYWRRYGAYGIYITGPYDTSYWSSISHIMVEDKTEFEPQIKNGHESRYYDKAKAETEGNGEAGIKEGYEWYYTRYYLGTKPTE